MKLKLENVGMIENTEIEFNGITVIAGENNTGKSTVGKMLFCIFHSFFRMEGQIKRERIKSISRAMSDFLQNFFYQSTNKRKEVDSFATHLAEGREQYVGDVGLVGKELEKFFGVAGQESEVEAVSNKIYNYLCIEDDEIRKIILRKQLECEFGMEVGHVNYPEKKTYVCLDVNGNGIEFSVHNQGEIDIVRCASLIKEAVYIDDPFVLDDLDMEMSVHMLHGKGHKEHLLYQIVDGRRKKEFGILDELIVEQKLQKLFRVMDGVCGGDLEAVEEGKRYVYQTGSLKGSLDMSNVSTGMKSFVILKTLLQNGSIDENVTVILDEPEIHLHPEWQLKFAEMIVLMQKEFNVNVLLNTHSPYFLNAVEVYADKYGISEKCKYYLAEEVGERSRMADVTLDTERIYAKLAKPLQELENMGYSDGNI